MKKRTYIAIAGLSFALGAGYLVSDAEARELKTNRATLQAACDKSGGVAWGTHSQGGYGCLSDKGWVLCDSSGRCEGGRLTSKPAKRSVRALRPSRRYSSDKGRVFGKAPVSGHAASKSKHVEPSGHETMTFKAAPVFR